MTYLAEGDGYLWHAAHLAGMSEDEIQTFRRLAVEADYLSYDQVRRENERLEACGSLAINDVIGASSDYPDERPINLTAVGDPSEDGLKAYLQSPEHANELAGPAAITLLERLMAQHPQLLSRLGYSCMLACNHIDPDGMNMQRWPLRNPSVRQFVLGGYRGSWRDQISWGYPTENFTQIRPEARASLNVISTYNPDFLGSVHASQFSAYMVTHGYSLEAANKLSFLLRETGLPINFDEPESKNDRQLDLGIFSAATAASYKDARASAEPETPIANIHDGGTTIIEHLPPTTSFLIPEIPMYIGLPDSQASRNASYYDVVRYRTSQATKIIDGLSGNLDRLSSWFAAEKQTPETERLYNAADWWRNTVPQILRSQLEACRDPAYRIADLTPVDVARLRGSTIINSLTYAGNVYRLARAARDDLVARNMLEVIDNGIAALGEVRQTPPGLQIGATALSILVGMKHHEQT